MNISQPKDEKESALLRQNHKIQRAQEELLALQNKPHRNLTLNDVTQAKKLLKNHSKRF